MLAWDTDPPRRFPEPPDKNGVLVCPERFKELVELVRKEQKEWERLSREADRELAER